MFRYQSRKKSNTGEKKITRIRRIGAQISVQKEINTREKEMTSIRRHDAQISSRKKSILGKENNVVRRNGAAPQGGANK